jgi:hypothetical protein
MWCRPRKVARSCEWVCEWPAKSCESADKKVWMDGLFCECPSKKCEWLETFPWLSTHARRQKCECWCDSNSASQEMFWDLGLSRLEPDIFALWWEVDKLRNQTRESPSFPLLTKDQTHQSHQINLPPLHLRRSTHSDLRHCMAETLRLKAKQRLGPRVFFVVSLY